MKEFLIKYIFYNNINKVSLVDWTSHAHMIQMSPLSAYHCHESQPVHDKVIIVAGHYIKLLTESLASKEMPCTMAYTNNEHNLLRVYDVLEHTRFSWRQHNLRKRKVKETQLPMSEHTWKKLKVK